MLCGDFNIDALQDQDGPSPLRPRPGTGHYRRMLRILETGTDGATHGAKARAAAARASGSDSVSWLNPLGFLGAGRRAARGDGGGAGAVVPPYAYRVIDLLLEHSGTSANTAAGAGGACGHPVTTLPYLWEADTGKEVVRSSYLESIEGQTSVEPDELAGPGDAAVAAAMARDKKLRRRYSTSDAEAKGACCPPGRERKKLLVRRACRLDYAFWIPPRAVETGQTGQTGGGGGGGGGGGKAAPRPAALCTWRPVHTVVDPFLVSETSRRMPKKDGSGSAGAEKQPPGGFVVLSDHFGIAGELKAMSLVGSPKDFAPARSTAARRQQQQEEEREQQQQQEQQVQQQQEQQQDGQPIAGAVAAAARGNSRRQSWRYDSGKALPDEIEL